MEDSPRKIGTGIQNKMNSRKIKAIEDLLFIDYTLTTKEMTKRMKKDGFNVSFLTFIDTYKINMNIEKYMKAKF